MKRAWLITYRDTANLGDAIQYIALDRILRQLAPNLIIETVHRESLPQFQPAETDTLIVNGWHRSSQQIGIAKAVFWGVHAHTNQRSWLRLSDGLVGARDPYTRDWLQRDGIAAEVVGCATMVAFERYAGPRSGIYSVDYEAPRSTAVTHRFEGTRPWSWQLQRASELLELYRTAELVITTRLHCALPCVAMGTPVKLIRNANEPERFGIAEYLGIHNREITRGLQLSYWRERYCSRLENLLRPVGLTDNASHPR